MKKTRRMVEVVVVALVVMMSGFAVASESPKNAVLAEFDFSLKDSGLYNSGSPTLWLGGSHSFEKFTAGGMYKTTIRNDDVSMVRGFINGLNTTIILDVPLNGISPTLWLGYTVDLGDIKVIPWLDRTLNRAGFEKTNGGVELHVFDVVLQYYSNFNGEAKEAWVGYVFHVGEASIQPSVVYLFGNKVGFSLTIRYPF